MCLCLYAVCCTCDPRGHVIMVVRSVGWLEWLSLASRQLHQKTKQVAAADTIDE